MKAVNLGGSFEKMKKFPFELTDTEKDFIKSLEVIPKKDCIWGYCIEMVCNNPTVLNVRTLIKDLKSASFDNPVVFQSVIGRESYQKLLNL